MDMNLNQLRYFYEVAKERGFTNAARSLRIQQPAISRMVQQLEDSLGFDLFERRGREVQLTPQGEEVFARCQRIFAEVEGLRAELGEIGGVCHGPLTIAAADPIASGFIPGILKDFVAKYPRVYPIINSGPASMLFEKIVSGSLEFGLFFHVPEVPSKLELSVFKPVRFYLVVRADLRRSSTVLESFIGSREVDDTDTRRFPTLEKLRVDHPAAKITISSNNLSAHREMVLKGLGVSILPDFLVEQDLKRGHLAALYPRRKFEFNMKLVKRKSSVLSLNARTFLEACK
jgi:DNA-binding transcriptional LysR family regulator